MPAKLVAVTDSVFPNLDPAREVLAKIGAEIRLAKEPTPDAILEVARDADAVLTTYAKVTADMIAQLTRCRVIGRFGIGVDNVDIPAATKAGIVVTRVPDYCLDEVSDHTMALLLALVRKIPSSNARTQAGRWEMRAVVPIHRLRRNRSGVGGLWADPAVGGAQGSGLRHPRGDLRSLRFEASGRARRRGAGGVRRIGEDLRLHFHPHAAPAGNASLVQRRCFPPNEADSLPDQYRARARLSMKQPWPARWTRATWRERLWM